MRISRKELVMQRGDYQVLGNSLQESMRMGVNRTGNEFADEMMSPTKRSVSRER